MSRLNSSGMASSYSRPCKLLYSSVPNSPSSQLGSSNCVVISPALFKEYVSFRLAENPTQVIDKKKPIPKEVQEGLNIYATNYLALAHLERNNPGLAEDMFLQVLNASP